MNCETDQDVTVYDVRFKPCASLEKKDYCVMTVKAPARSLVLTRESGLKPLKNYELEVRARNAGYEGNWNGILEHIGMSICISLSKVRLQYTHPRNKRTKNNKNVLYPKWKGKKLKEVKTTQVHCTQMHDLIV